MVGVSIRRFYGLSVVLLAALLGTGCGSPPAPESRPSGPETVTKKPESTPSVARTPTRPHFAVQVGAFVKRARADELAFQLSTRYQKLVLTTPTQVGNRTIYRVRILVDTEAEAEALALTLFRDQKLNSWVVALP